LEDKQFKAPSIEEVTREILEQMKQGFFNVPVTTLDYLATGLEAPVTVVQFTSFVRTHSIQLESMALPKTLWKVIHLLLLLLLFVLRIVLLLWK
jgi:hypothetical protein